MVRSREPEDPGPPAASAPLGLELDGAELRRMLALAGERLAAYVDGLADAPASLTEGGAALARSLAAPPPEEGRPLEELLALVFERALPIGFNTAGPGYLAYIPGGGLLSSAVADLVATALNRYVGVWVAAPGLVQLEANVVRFLCALVGFAPSSGGFLTTGGSLANWCAVVAARRARLGLDARGGVLYASDQTHHSVRKAALLAGFDAASVRSVASDGGAGVRLDALRAAIARDRHAGLTPFFVCANAGTTNTGAIDDLAGVAALAAEHELWLHVDAAYGGFFLLTERGRAALAGIERADSVTLDPHKGLFLPYGTGALVVRDQARLRAAFGMHADYLPSMQTEPDLVDFCEVSPELSRDFRGLRVWLPLCLHGVGAFRRALDEKLDLARLAAERLRRIPGIVVLAEPALSIVAFRAEARGLDDAACDALGRALLERVNAGRRVFLTATTLERRFVLRICVLSFRTHAARVLECVDAIAAARAELAPAP